MSGKRIRRDNLSWDFVGFRPAITEELRYRKPMRVSEIMVFSMSHGRTGFAICPRCKLTMEYEYAPFCGHCGQRLDWSRYRHAVFRISGDHAGGK